MTASSRRTFMLQVAVGGGALAAGAAHAQGAPMLSEKDPQAAALGYVADTKKGYVADTKKADAKKFPKHKPDQKCSNCQVYTGKPKEAAGPCAIFAGKQVAAEGWCSAWVKKA
jgi:hypothetical protein